jgi:hypothetical protein
VSISCTRSRASSACRTQHNSSRQPSGAARREPRHGQQQYIQEYSALLACSVCGCPMCRCQHLRSEQQDTAGNNVDC